MVRTWLLLIKVAFGVVACIQSDFAHGQWNAISMHPVEASDSWGHGVARRTVGGTARVNGTTHGVLFTDRGFVVLTPPNGETSRLLGLRESFGVGNAWISNVGRAMLWSFSSNSAPSDLHPVNATYSIARGVGGGQQVGVVRYDDPNNLNDRAALWYSSADGFVSLHPRSAFLWSAAYGTDGQIQAGHVDRMACIWRGTANSFQSIHPAGSSDSVALSAHSGRQGGWAAINADRGRGHAALWHGTAASFVDLHPAGAYESQVNDVFGDYQVGWAFWPTRKAVLWNGTAESAFDLHALLPPEYSGSNAWGVEADEFGNLIVVGTATNARLGRSEAVMWTYVVPEPASLAVLLIGLPLISRLRRKQ